MTDLQVAVKSEDRRTQLEAIRDYIARELEANLCNTCLNSRLRTGDQASLLLRLQKVLEDIEALPAENEEVSEFERIRLARVHRLAEASNSAQPDDLGSKHSKRRSGGRRTGRISGSDTGSVAGDVS